MTDDGIKQDVRSGSPDAEPDRRRWYDAHDAGPLAEGWRYQRDTPAYVTPYADPDSDMAPRPATAVDLVPLLAAARRYRDMR